MKKYTQIKEIKLNHCITQVVLFLLCLFIVIITPSCKKDKTSSTTQEEPSTSDAVGDGLSSEENEILEESGGSNEVLKKLRGADGQLLQKTTATPKEQFINAILREAKALIEQKDYLNHDKVNETMPSHIGIAYLWGGKEWRRRSFPSKTGSNSIHQKYAVYGLDCSGFISYLLNGVGIMVDNKTTNTSNFEGSLRKILKEYKNDNFALGLLNLQKIPQEQMKDGDIILWEGHIGIVGKTTDNLTLVFQSNGTGTPVSEQDQAKNLGLKRGVRYCTFNEITSRGFKGNNYKILRIIASGDTLNGGIVFDIDETGLHGKVCALQDQATQVEWNNGDNIFVPGTRVELNAGKLNTELLLNIVGNTSIAKYCTQYNYNGYNDWYLPSRDELQKIWYTLAKYDIGSFSNSYYASSSDVDDLSFWVVNFTKGNVPGSMSKGIKRLNRPTGIDYHYYSVRAIRNF